MSLRIVIADDEPLLRRDLKEVLEDLGYRVVGEAMNGSEALRLIQQEMPDVAILDIKMPEMDGIQVARKVSRQHPVVILTAFSERHLIEKAKDAGVMAYITKPFRVGDVSSAVELAVSLFMEKSALTERVATLKSQLETRKLLERAKGLMMENEGLSEPRAYRRLQEISMKKNKPIKDVAEAVIMMYG